MTSKEIYKWFELYFPQFSKYVTKWFPNGKNSVRVRQSNGQDFIFTYHNKSEWMFETVDNFLKRTKGDK